ncbi:hypothetical protein PGB90_010103 [Kerria lacca]
MKERREWIQPRSVRSKEGGEAGVPSPFPSVMVVLIVQKRALGEKDWRNSPTKMAP